jgi:DME family drug/metabolite transporter
MKKINGKWLILMASILFGTTGTAQAFAPAGASPLTVGAVRMVVGGLLLFIISLVRGKIRDIGTWPKADAIPAAVCMAAFQPFFFAGVSNTGVAIGTIVALGSSPIFAGILAHFIRGEKLGWHWGIATASAVAGNILLVSSQRDMSMNIAGIIYALIAGLSYAMYSLTSKKLLENYSPEEVMSSVGIIAGILLLPLLLINNISWVTEPRGMLIALHLGFFNIVLAYYLYNTGLNVTPVSTATTITLVEPLTATLLGVFILKEEMNTYSILGLLLIIAGLVVLFSKDYKPKGKTVSKDVAV